MRKFVMILNDQKQFKMNFKNKFDGLREWDHRFSFLKGMKLNHVYLTILGFARTKKDIEKYHNLLPENCRIMRNQLIDFKEFWDKYIRPDNVSNQKVARTPEITVKWILHNQCMDSIKAVTSYYCKYLKSKKAEYSEYLQFGMHDSMSITNDKEDGRNIIFTANIHNSIFPVDLKLSEDKKRVLVQIFGNQNMLTEDLAYKLGELPAYRMLQDSAEHGFGTILDFSYDVPAEKLLPYLEEFQRPNKHWAEFLLTDAKFLTELSDSLRKIGIPLLSNITLLNLTTERDLLFSKMKKA